MTVHRTWMERRAEQWLSERRRDEERERRRKARRKANEELVAPGPRKRPIVGELIEDVVGIAVDVVRDWKRGR